MQIARYEAVIRYIREYQCIYVKKISQMILFNVKIKRVLIACHIKNIDMNLRNIDCYNQIHRMYNLGRSGSETGLFGSMFVWGWGRYGVGMYARPFPRDTRGSTKLGQWC